MKKFIEKVIAFMVAIFFGMTIMYFYTQKYMLPNLEKNVTVNDNGISDGIDNIYDAVVVVENYSKNKLTGIGSGFIYDANGYIMTNHHVISGASEVKVILSNGNTISATVVGSDQYADIAILKINKSYVQKVATIGDNSKTKVGDTVFTIGSPISSNYSGTVTRGILSGKNRMVEVSVSTSSTSDWIMNVMQTDAAINPGNSGGPLCNVSGEVIGVNSMKLVEDSVEGIGFAITIEDAMQYANKIVNKVEIKRSYLGIKMADLSLSSFTLKNNYGITIDSSITSGVIVLQAETSGPCYKAGIKNGDVIVKVGDYDVKNIAELRYYLYKYQPNETINVVIIRGIEKKVAKVTLGEAS